MSIKEPEKPERPENQTHYRNPGDHTNEPDEQKRRADPPAEFSRTLADVIGMSSDKRVRQTIHDRAFGSGA
jgi:hypothetical protein